MPVTPRFTSTIQGTYDFPTSGDVVPFVQGNWYHRSSVNYILNGAPGGFFGAVDTFGANIGIRIGDQLQASLFCKNCTNEHIPQNIQLDPGDENDGLTSYGQVFTLDSVRSFGLSLSLRY